LSAPSSAISEPARARAPLEWLPVGAGLLLLYAPTFHDLARGLWRQDDNAHAPVVLAVVAWLFWRERHALRLPFAPALAPGLALLLPGLASYVFGRAHGFILLEAGSLPLVLAGALLALGGRRALRAFAFALLFTLFLVPVPGFLVDAVSGPLKQTISALAAELLRGAGYPVARSGVVLAVGPYQLLVADACSGLNSMYSLLAVGALYLHLVRRPGALHNGAIIASLLPIAFLANMLRVMVLVLITYHFGDDAGQTFIHRLSGLTLFAAALGLILALDAALARLCRST